MNEEIKKIINDLHLKKPKWVSGTGSHSDLYFLYTNVLNLKAKKILEIGSASGFSASVMALAASQNFEDFEIYSYDLYERFYADNQYLTGEVAKEILERNLCDKIFFRNPFYSDKAKEEHNQGSFDLAFIDAHHGHPWPFYDFLQIYKLVKKGGMIIFHDINLPLAHPEIHASSGVKFLFDSIKLEKTVDNFSHNNIPNIGSIIIQDDIEEVVQQLKVDMLNFPIEIHESNFKSLKQKFDCLNPS